MIDLHCDTVMCLIDDLSQGDLYENSWKIDIKRLQRAKSRIQDFALYVNMEKHPNSYARYCDMLALFQEQVTTYSNHIMHIRSYADIKACYDTNKIGALLSVEEGGVFEGDLHKLRKAYDDGVRLITITWNYANGLGEPHCGDATKSLTSKGVEFVELMEDLGMIVDCSHLNDGGTKQLGQILRKPFIASHSNARALTNHSRNLSDELITLIANKGGVIGLNFAQAFLGTSSISRIEDIVKHGLYIRNLGGDDVVALGTDFDGIRPDTEIEDIAHMPELYDAFIKAGLSEYSVDKIFWKNADRLFKEIL